MLDNSIKTNSCRLPSLLFFSAEHQGGSSLSHRALEVTTVIALRCIPWRTALKLSTITCSAGWVRGVTNAHPDAARETGVFVNRLSRTGSGDLTGTALKARRETYLMWVPEPPSLKWRCGSKRGGLWRKSSSLLRPILTTAEQHTAPTPVRALWKVVNVDRWVTDGRSHGDRSPIDFWTVVVEARVVGCLVLWPFSSCFCQMCFFSRIRCDGGELLLDQPS